MSKLPTTTLDWSQRFNKQKAKYLLIAVILAFFVTLNAYKVLHRAQVDSELVSVVVASRDIDKYSQLKTGDTQFRKIRKDQVPENTIYNPKDIENLTSLITISKGQILVTQFFKNISDPNSISAELEENMLAIPVGFDWLIAPVPDIKVGDIVDIIASESHKTKSGNQTILTAEAKFPIRNAKVLRIVKEGDYAQSGHLVLEVTEEQAKNLMKAQALKLLINVIVK